MKKKGFTLTEIIITITIIGILSLLGLNYVKKNVNRYDPLFYYQAYDALTKGFADAVANNVNMDATSLCNYYLTIWNIDEANSFCGSGEAVEDPGDVALLNSNEFPMKYLSKFNIFGVIADRIFALDKMFIGSAFAASVDLTGPCPPGLAAAINEGGATAAQEGFNNGCEMTILGNQIIWQPSVVDQSSSGWGWYGSSSGGSSGSSGSSNGGPTPCTPTLYYYGNQPNCHVRCNCNSYNHFHGNATFVQDCGYNSNVSGYTNYTWEEYCNNPCIQDPLSCKTYTCDCDGYAEAQSENNVQRFYNLCGGTAKTWLFQCTQVYACGCNPYRTAVKNGTVDTFLSNCGHDNQYWEDKCTVAPVDNCNCSGYSNAVALNTLPSFLNSCGHDSSYWEDLCNENPEPVVPQTGDLVGIIRTQYGLIFEFYSDVTFTLGQNQQGQNVNLTYFAIKVSKQDNANLMPVYFIVYPATHEMFPASPELIDNKTVLPAFLSSDFNNNKNNPVTKYTTYRSARCEKETRDPVNNYYIIPPAHSAYAHFVNANNLSSYYLTDYCADHESITWLDSEARNAPRSSLEVKTAPPNGMR